MTSFFRYALMALGTIALTLPSAASFAQSNEEMPEIVVKTETPVVRDGYDANRRPVEMMQLSRRVGYEDLNIGTHSGALALHKRVEEAAQAMCAELKKIYPRATEHNLPSGSCVREAINSAMPEVNAAIAAAESAHHERPEEEQQ